VYICPELRLIYLAQPRTASRACSQFLQAQTPLRRTGGHHDMDLAELRFRRRDGWKVVTTVRNHWDIIVSWWHHNPRWFNPPQGTNDFGLYAREFTRSRDNHYVRAHRMYWEFQPEATDIVRYESLWDDLARVTGLPVTDQERQHFIGKSDRKPYREYYDAETREFIGEYYATEIEEYGYTF